MSNENPFSDDYEVDENRPIREEHSGSAQLHFADFGKEGSRNEDESARNTFFHTHYYKSDVTYHDIYKAFKEIYTRTSRAAIGKLTKCRNQSHDLDSSPESSTPEPSEDPDCGLFFPLWTCFAIALSHLVIATLAFEHENITKNTVIFAAVTVSVQCAALFATLKKHQAADLPPPFFNIGVANTHYLVLRFLAMPILAISSSKFVASLLVLICQLLFVIFSFRAGLRSCLHIEILKWVVVSLLDFFL